MAMSPPASMAALAIHRCRPSAGANVLCWATNGLLPGERISYQRTPARLLPTLTVCVTTRDSWPSAKRRYWRRFMSRSLSVSSFLDLFVGWGTQSWKLQRLKLYGETATLAGDGLKVPVGVDQSTWNCQSWKVLPGGHCDALMERRDRVAEHVGVERELAEQPAVVDAVVEHDRIAVVGRGAHAGQAAPQRVAVGGPVPSGAGGLVVHRELEVDP